MQKDSELNKIASKHLGQSGSYAVYTDKFDSTLLVAMSRDLARKDWNIKGDEFIGLDVWHGHESTFLTNKGLPVAGTLKIIYSANTEYMVESKSLKLYLNSFDMCKMGEDMISATKNYIKQIEQDLSNLLSTKVQVHFFYNNQESSLVMNNPAMGFSDLFQVIPTSELESIIFSDYKAQEKHLKFIQLENPIEERICRFKTNVLRSRCRHTKQKDTGEAFVFLKTKSSYVDKSSLLKEIVSLREVDEFHEFCAEKLFVELISHPEVIECCVMLLYSRRGSLDINPVRATSISLIPMVMQQVNVYTKKQMGQ